jgi:hypothetical protein
MLVNGWLMVASWSVNGWRTELSQPMGYHNPQDIMYHPHHHQPSGI